MGAGGCGMPEERLGIAPEIRDRLSTERLNEIVDAREHTVLVCARCRETVAPESPVAMAVQLYTDGRNDLVQVTHR